MALRFGLVDGARAEQAQQRLVADIRGRDIRLSTGFVGVSHLLPVLSARGEDGLAWRLMEQDAFPSWLFSVKHGATTIWERWDGWTPENGFQDAGMNSFNHYSLGSCGEWMYQTAAGIGLHPDAPGFQRMVIRPRPGGTLTHLAATHDSPYGRIASAWRRDAAGTTYDIVIPVNTTAEIHLAAASADAVREGDAPAATAPGVRLVKHEDGDAIFAVGSGSYRFVVP
ncbi:MAG: hypothetical protein H0X45_04845 [Planctomycetes bacterium]|nr:hypothetical protein [Planctomycetota bacterium]